MIVIQRNDHAYKYSQYVCHKTCVEIKVCPSLKTKTKTIIEHKI